MATAQNGWPVVDAGAMDTGPIYGNVYAPGGILAGDVMIVCRWHAAQYHRRVEPLVAGTSWGYDKRAIGTGSTWSCHAAGTAWDLNANQHNDGDPPSRSFSQAQIDVCHQLEAESHNTIRWGGDWSDPDGMHWEIVGTPAQVAAFAREIEGDPDMFLPHEGDQGEAVKYWQYKLEDLGYDVGVVDGVYGPKTVAAVNASRAAHKEGPHTQITGWHARTIDADLYGRG